VGRGGHSRDPDDVVARTPLGPPLPRGYDAPLMRSINPLVTPLARIPFFAGLDDDALERVAAGTRTRRFRRGEVIFHAGDPGDALFIIVSGEVKISLPSETGDEAIIATLRAGDVFGELALLDGAARSATASALSATEAVVLPRDRFRELIATEPNVRDALLASLAGELRRLTIHVEELHFLDMTGRVAARLVRLAEESGPADDDGTIRLRSSLTQGELASMVGCTRQSVNKLLGQFSDEGLVRLDREGIAITDLSGLVAASRR
jgi:CRP/FNR family cyclic AMP-dependent transcriptional regulator